MDADDGDEFVMEIDAWALVLMDLAELEMEARYQAMCELDDRSLWLDL